MGDLSARAIASLRTCDSIACEDTRVASKLLRHHGITDKRLISYRDANEQRQVGSLIEKIQNGQQVGLISDAGTPGISDPGFRIVRECRRKALPVSVIPGPCAFVTALVGSGFPSDSFFFGGFLPNKSTARRRLFASYKDFKHTCIFYESCHRIEKSLADLSAEIGPDRYVCVSKELTKLFERWVVGKLQSVLSELKTVAIKGEFVVVVAPADFVL